MKTIAFIFAVFIALLSAEPIIKHSYLAFKQDAQSCMENGCCKKEKDTDKQAATNGCKANCNPIASCVCSAFLSGEALNSFKVNPITVGLKKAVNENSLTGYTYTCFQPPEVI